MRRYSILLLILVISALLPINAFAAAPTVSTGSATGSSNSQKTLSGTVGATGDKVITSRGFQYGSTSNYGSSVSAAQTPTYSTSFGAPGAGDGQFDGPVGISFSASGDIFITDLTNSRIQRFNSSGVYQSQWGSAGTGNGEFDAPSGIMITTSTDIYVVDSNNDRVQRFNSSGVYQSQWGSAGTGNGEFSDPFGITIDSDGYIYVADASNNRIQKFSTLGTYQSQWGSAGTGNGEFNSPVGIGVDSENNIYVVDSSNSRIQKFDSSGTFITTWGSSGSSSGQFNSPSYITIDSADRVYIADSSNSRIQRFTSNGTFIDSWNTSLNSPQGIGISPTGVIHVVDSNNADVNLYVTSGDFSSTISDFSCGTYHYRAFATNEDGTSYGSDQTFDAGGCGGGAIIVAPSAASGSPEALTFTVNNGSPVTLSRTVSLTLNADPRTTTGYAVSLTPGFDNASILPIASTATFTLPEVVGNYTVYLKYYSTSGHASDILTQNISYLPTMSPTPPSPSTAPTAPTTLAPITTPPAPIPTERVSFVRSLGLGSTGDDVLRLQQFLNSNGGPITTAGAGSPGQETRYFGPATKQALIRFQEMHADHILKPLGLARGTGIFGPATRAFINAY